MKRYELVVIGAGPAGLSAAAEAASRGMETIVFDENARPGGQLFKQIHKFFGSREHKAGVRGVDIATRLVGQAEESGARVILDAAVMGVYPHKDLCVMKGEQVYTCKADNIIIATGASENTLAFPGWTLPGVMGAGSAQTQMNLHGVLPGRRVLMLGSGNVGLVVGLQLIQAGCELAAVVDAAPRIGGYGVHAAKLARTGVPFHLGHTIVRAEGEGHVERAVVARVDGHGRAVPRTEKEFEVDAVCVAVGLSPMYQLAMTAGCALADEPQKGGVHPVADEYGATSVPGVFVAGDAAGIEEASSAMIMGRIAGAAAARRAGYLTREQHESLHAGLLASLGRLRQGMFAGPNKGDPGVTATDEGIPLSAGLLARGYLEEGELGAFPGFGSGGRGVRPVAECTQNIPCDPCQDICPRKCIAVGERITGLPSVRPGAGCTGCGLCVSACPGQAVFLVDRDFAPGFGAVSLPYEFLPLPVKGTRGRALDRAGRPVCAAEVAEIRDAAAYDRTPVLTIKVPADMVDRARFFVAEEGNA